MGILADAPIPRRRSSHTDPISIKRSLKLLADAGISARSALCAHSSRIAHRLAEWVAYALSISDGGRMCSWRLGTGACASVCFAASCSEIVRLKLILRAARCASLVEGSCCAPIVGWACDRISRIRRHGRQSRPIGTESLGPCVIHSLGRTRSHSALHSRRFLRSRPPPARSLRRHPPACRGIGCTRHARGRRPLLAPGRTGLVGARVHHSHSAIHTVPIVYASLVSMSFRHRRPQQRMLREGWRSMAVVAQNRCPKASSLGSAGDAAAAATSEAKATSPWATCGSTPCGAA